MNQRLGLINELRIRYVGIFAFLILLSGLIIKFDQDQAHHLQGISERFQETLYWEGRLQEGVEGLLRGEETAFDSLDLVMLGKSLRDGRRALEGYQALENRRTAGGLLVFLGSCIGVWISLSIPRIAALVEEIRGAAGTLATSSEEIGRISDEHVHQSARQAEAIQELASSSDQIAGAARSIRGNAEAMTQAMGRALASCNQGREQLDQITEEMASLQMQVEGIDESMVALGEVASRISSITEIIDEISDQTKLLALNAAIEAAGAGESGKRFAVVATEVRRLSERTAEATSEIASLVEAVEERVSQTTNLTRSGTAAVERGAGEIRQAGVGLQRIFETVEETSNQVEEISASTEEQKTSTELMAQTVGEVQELVSQVHTGAEGARAAARRLGPLVGRLLGLVDGVARAEGEGSEAEAA